MHKIYQYIPSENRRNRIFDITYPLKLSQPIIMIIILPRAVWKLVSISSRHQAGRTGLNILVNALRRERMSNVQNSLALRDGETLRSSVYLR